MYEPYHLINAGYGGEALHEIRNFLEEHERELVVILIGNTGLVNKFLKANMLTSRFPQENHLHFNDFSPSECVDILHKRLVDRGIDAPFLLKGQGDDRSKVEMVFKAFTRSLVWSNMRDVRAIADRISGLVALRFQKENGPFNLKGAEGSSTGTPKLTITLDEVKNAVREEWVRQQETAADTARDFGIDKIETKRAQKEAGPVLNLEGSQSTTESNVQPAQADTEIASDACLGSDRGKKGDDGSACAAVSVEGQRRKDKQNEPNDVSLSKANSPAAWSLTDA